ncbi:MAG: hypothetical protein AAGA64_12535 [Bacteroidota bacterium]
MEFRNSMRMISRYGLKPIQSPRSENKPLQPTSFMWYTGHHTGSGSRAVEALAGSGLSFDHPDVMLLTQN